MFKYLHCSTLLFKLRRKKTKIMFSIIIQTEKKNLNNTHPNYKPEKSDVQIFAELKIIFQRIKVILSKLYGP